MFVAVLFVMNASEANTELPRTDLEDVTGGAAPKPNNDSLLRSIQEIQESLKKLPRPGTFG